MESQNIEQHRCEMNYSEALKYCKSNQDTYIVTIFPAAGKDISLADDILRHYGRIVFRKKLILNGEGPFNFIRQIYPSEKWLGTLKNGFSGARNKAAYCFPEEGPVQVYAYESESPNSVNEAKKLIRDHCRAGNHSVHINDMHKETVRLAQFVLNENISHVLNNARLFQYKWFYSLLDRYKEALATRTQNPDHYCVDGSSVMSIYGIREGRDLDYLHYRQDELGGVDDFINSHNEEIRNHKFMLEEIVLNPQNHFYFDDVKFASLGVVLEMKRNRGEDKDVRDCALIKSVLSGKSIPGREPDERDRRIKRILFYYFMRFRRMLMVDRCAAFARTFLQKISS